ncbi:uncharacterized protein LOC127079523 [Lathyrus oleraceus]|uniref:uncharacterized protein LOC127079523 n=1 Tax=Pisum sativum TaxID=3888 RepID=UPI0021CF8936|nr:uncharacterized protein LOC127079523 [Pisum sativum]
MAPIQQPLSPNKNKYFERESFSHSRSLSSLPFTKFLCNFFSFPSPPLTAKPAGEDGGGRPTAAALPSSPATFNPNPKESNTYPILFWPVISNPTLVLPKTSSINRIGVTNNKYMDSSKERKEKRLLSLICIRRRELLVAAEVFTKVK